MTQAPSFGYMTSLPGDVSLQTPASEALWQLKHCKELVGVVTSPGLGVEPAETHSQLQRSSPLLQYLIVCSAVFTVMHVSVLLMGAHVLENTSSLPGSNTILMTQAPVP